MVLKKHNNKQNNIFMIKIIISVMSIAAIILLILIYTIGKNPILEIVFKLYFILCIICSGIVGYLKNNSHKK